MPFFPQAVPGYNSNDWKVNVTGSIGVYTYLGSNCTSQPNSALIPLLNFRRVNDDNSNPPWPYSVFVMRAWEGVQVENRVRKVKGERDAEGGSR